MGPTCQSILKIFSNTFDAVSNRSTPFLLSSPHLFYFSTIFDLSLLISSASLVLRHSLSRSCGRRLAKEEGSKAKGVGKIWCCGPRSVVWDLHRLEGSKGVGPTVGLKPRSAFLLLIALFLIVVVSDVTNPGDLAILKQIFGGLKHRTLPTAPDLVHALRLRAFLLCQSQPTRARERISEKKRRRGEGRKGGEERGENSGEEEKMRRRRERGRQTAVPASKGEITIFKID